MILVTIYPNPEMDGAGGSLWAPVVFAAVLAALALGAMAIQARQARGSRPFPAEDPGHDIESWLTTRAADRKAS